MQPSIFATGSDQELPRVCVTTLCDWSGKLAPSLEPIRCKHRSIVA